MAKPSLRQLEYLVVLAATLNFRKAAAEAHVSQPTLSGQISELERRLGLALFERSRHSVKLTPMGKTVADRARQLLKDVDDLCELARSAGTGLGGVIRLGVPPTLGPYLLPHVVPELHGAYPDLKLYVREEPPRILERSLAEGLHDLLLTTTPVIAGDFTTRDLFREPLLVGLAQDHPLAGRGRIRIKDLAGQSVLALGAGHRLYEQVQQMAESFGAKLLSDYEGTSLATLRQMVGMGMGLSFFPALYVQSEMTNDRQVLAMRLADHSPDRTVGLVWRKGSPRETDFQFVAAAVDRVVRRRFRKILTPL